MTTFLLIGLALVLLLLKGFFAGSEIALVNADKVKLNARANQGDPGARRVLDLFRQPDVLLGTTLVGNSIATIVLGTVTTLLALRWFGDLGAWIAFAIATPLLLIFGEVVPKSVYQQKSDKIAPIAVYPLRACTLLLYPLVFVFSRIARLAARIVGGGQVEQSLFMTREQMRAIVDMTERTASVDAFDRERVRRVIRFSETSVGEAMTPMAEVATLAHDANMLRAVARVRRSGHHRLPVFRSNSANIIGICSLSCWDLFEADTLQREPKEFIRPAHYVLQFQTLDQVLPQLQLREDRMAIVVDEFGQAIGILTVTDIFHQVFGELDLKPQADRPKTRRPGIERLGEGRYRIDARLSVAAVNDRLKLTLNTRDNHTIGGWVMSHLGRIPGAGESVVDQGYRFEVEQVTERGIETLHVEAVGSGGSGV